MPFSGVFSWQDGQLRILSHELKGLNGVVFSPDEKYLCVGNWDRTLRREEIFIDLSSEIASEEALDAM